MQTGAWCQGTQAGSRDRVQMQGGEAGGQQQREVSACWLGPSWCWWWGPWDTHTAPWAAVLLRNGCPLCVQETPAWVRTSGASLCEPLCEAALMYFPRGVPRRLMKGRVWREALEVSWAAACPHSGCLPAAPGPRGQSVVVRTKSAEAEARTLLCSRFLSPVSRMSTCSSAAVCGAENPLVGRPGSCAPGSSRSVCTAWRRQVKWP